MQGAGRDVTWAEFLDADRLVTCSRSGLVVVWKCPEIRPTTVVTLVDGAVPALSPDRKWLAYSTGQDVGVYDLTKKGVVAQQSMPGTNLRTCVVSRGDRGAVAVTKRQRWESPSFAVDTVDTTGAGDAFVGALAYTVVLRWDWGRSLVASGFSNGSRLPSSCSIR